MFRHKMKEHKLQALKNCRTSLKFSLEIQDILFQKKFCIYFELILTLQCWPTLFICTLTIVQLFRGYFSTGLFHYARVLCIFLALKLRKSNKYRKKSSISFSCVPVCVSPTWYLKILFTFPIYKRFASLSPSR